MKNKIENLELNHCVKQYGQKEQLGECQGGPECKSKIYEICLSTKDVIIML